MKISKIDYYGENDMRIEFENSDFETVEFMKDNNGWYLIKVGYYIKVSEVLECIEFLKKPLELKL